MRFSPRHATLFISLSLSLHLCSTIYLPLSHTTFNSHSTYIVNAAADGPMFDIKIPDLEPGKTESGAGLPDGFFFTKNPNLGMLRRNLEWKVVLYIYSDYLEYFTTIGHIL
jgi:hypothetical protein